MIYNIYAMRDELTGFLPPTYDINDAAAMRNFRVAILRSSDSIHYMPSDYYFPVFANIGEQAIKNKEIYAQGTVKDDEVFGYQEAWADYRYRPNRVTGEMRSSAPQSLDVWHLGDDYESLPSLSDSWIREDSKTVNRVLAVSDNVSAQLFCDIYVRNLCTRPMPLYSIPGLIDHH